MQKGLFSAALMMAGVVGGVALPATVRAAPGGDAAAGKVLFARCMACHDVKPGAPNRMGPNLAGIVGRKAGAVKGFRYSAAMSKANLKWDEATLDKWLARPAALVPGTSMAFAGLANAADRKAMIAYLRKPVP